MHHCIKGIVGICVEDTAGFSIKGNIIDNVQNLRVEPFSVCNCYENLDEAQAGNVRENSVAAVRGVNTGKRRLETKHNEINGIFSDQANVKI